MVTIASGPFEMDLTSLSLELLEGEELEGLERWLVLRSTSSGTWAQFSELKDDMRPSATPAPRDTARCLGFLVCQAHMQWFCTCTCSVYTHF